MPQIYRLFLINSVPDRVANAATEGRVHERLVVNACWNTRPSEQQRSFNLVWNDEPTSCYLMQEVNYRNNKSSPNQLRHIGGLQFGCAAASASSGSSCQAFTGSDVNL